MEVRHPGAIRLSSMILALLLVLGILPFSAMGQGRELQTVRVGFFAFDAYHIMDENGVRSGYGYDLLQHMVGYTDWQYEYVGYDKSWGEMQEMLEKGEIDLLTSAQKTEDRMKRFDFSDDPIGTSAAILTTKAGNTEYVIGDPADWSGIRIGMLEGNSRNQNLADYAAEAGFTYVPVYFDSTDEMITALKETGQIDAILTSNLRSIHDEWVLAEFASSPFYVMVRKGDSALLEELNQALNLLFNNEPGLRSKLMNTYYSVDSGTEIAFTAEERAYIADMQDVTLTALLNPDRAPISSFKDGNPVGTLSAIIDEIISRSGLNIKFIETSSCQEYQELVNSGVADIRFDAWYNYTEAENTGYRLTSPYVQESLARLHLRDNYHWNSVGLLTGSGISAEYLDELIDKYAEITYYDTTAEIIDAVRSGEQDVAYLYTRIAEAAVYDDITNRLVFENTFAKNVEFSIAVNAHQSALLFSIMNKVIASISESAIENLTNTYTNVRQQPFSILGYMYDNPFSLVLAVTILFLLIISFAAALLLSRKRKQDLLQLTEEKRHAALLADALAVAERADTAKSQFLSQVSHEMRTPLNAIIGFLALSKGAEPNQIEKYLENSKIAAQQLLALINDVLDMASIESGKIKIAHSPFNFKHLIHSLTNVYVPQCTMKELTFETQLLSPLDDWLVGDQLRVNQILINLISNAVKFTEKGHIWLKISQLDSQGNKVFVRFEVTDTGCGMSEEMQSRLFKAFEQESAATAQKYGGSGLGLSIVKTLVTLMHGTIQVESAPGVGTTFIVDLPFDQSEVNMQVQIPTDVERLHLLVVDDIDTEREYISVVLERIGIRHTCVESGKLALQELERAYQAQDSYNICLVDWKIPDMNGIEITRRIREKYKKEIILIVVSAYEHYQVDTDAMEAGANLFVSKPLFQSSLLDMLMTLTGSSITMRSAPVVEQDFTGKRVLLAEDNAVNQMVAVGLINKFGIECEVAGTGEIALEKFLASAPGYYDAILMDIQMPKMNGYEATKAIRASSHPNARTIQIIALTANAFLEDITKTLASGMNNHVSKPIEPEALLAALSKAFLNKT